MSRTRSSALVALAAALAAAGCGGGDHKAASDTVQRVYRAPTTGQTTPQDTTVAPAPTTPATKTTPNRPRPPGSTSTTPGGTEPARTELTFTASKSGVRPHNASVAPFVAVRVSLVSADHSSHRLVIGGHTLKVGGTLKNMFVELPGLRTGESYKGKADGSIPIKISASFEPGP